jgi:flavin reductase (DIM6/NTAB) family NADH-FMN oxidoreductase RutF
MFKIFNPRQTVLVTCTSEIEQFGKKIEKNNIIAIDWHMPLSFEPLLYAISVGKNRFSLELIRKSGIFAVNFISYNLNDAVIFCGRNSGRNVDKFKETRLNEIPCEVIECVRIKEALAHIECEVIQEINVGDHILFIAKIIKIQEHDIGKRIFHLSENKFTTTNN